MTTKSDSTSKTDASAKPTGRTLDAPATKSAKPGGERYAPSGLTTEPYQGTRVRRWEPYQLPVVRRVLEKAGVSSQGDIDEAANDPQHCAELARMLGTCLVGRQKPGTVGQLFRKGQPGVQKILSQLSPKEIATAMKAAVELSSVL